MSSNTEAPTSNRALTGHWAGMEMELAATLDLQGANQCFEHESGLVGLPEGLRAPLNQWEGVDDSANYYTYRPLQNTGQTIRLLRLLPGQPRAPVCCTVEEVSLLEASPFEALSYTWGSSQDVREIVLNGERFQVRPNLHAFLSRLRQPDTQRLLWADAICINQSLLTLNSSLEWLLLAHLDSVCSDPHDQVYGLLGLASDCNDDSGPQVNYAKELPDLFWEVLAFCKPMNVTFLAQRLMRSLGLSKQDLNMDLATNAEARLQSLWQMPSLWDRSVPIRLLETVEAPRTYAWPLDADSAPWEGETYVEFGIGDMIEDKGRSRGATCQVARAGDEVWTIDRRGLDIIFILRRSDNKHLTVISRAMRYIENENMPAWMSAQQKELVTDSAFTGLHVVPGDSSQEARVVLNNSAMQELIWQTIDFNTNGRPRR